MLVWAHDTSGNTCKKTPAGFYLAALKSFVAPGILVLGLGTIATLTGCGGSVSPSSPPQASPTTPTASALGPQLGYLWIASDRTLRPILGIPGASQIGESVTPAGDYIAATTSARARIAILQGTDGSIDLMTLPSGTPVGIGLTLATGAKLRLSPSATAALVFLPGSTSASLITGLPSSPKVQTVAAPAAIIDGAVSDSGTVALESARSVFVLALSGSPVTLASLGAPGGLAFLPNHDDLLFADAAANTLTLLRSTTGSPAPQTISTNGLLQTPSAVGVSGSGRWALVANSGSQTGVRVDLSNLTATSVSCACQPTLAEPLADDGAFRLTSLASGPNWLVATAPTALAAPLTLFIPALPIPALPATNHSAVVASAVRP